MTPPRNTWWGLFQSQPVVWFPLYCECTPSRAGAEEENQNAVFKRNSDPWKCDPWKCWESKCSFLLEIVTRETAIEPFSCPSFSLWLTSTTKLSTGQNVTCHLRTDFPYVANLNPWHQKWLITPQASVYTALTCVDCRLFWAQDAEVWVTEGPDRSNLVPIGGQDFLMPQRGDCLKGVLSHKFLPASKTLHKAGTIRWNCISNFLPSP